MLEKEERASEELRTLDDYFEELNKILSLMGEIDGSGAVEDLDKIITQLCKAMLKKYKYILKISAKWRKRQGFVSRLKDSFKSMKESKEEKKEKMLDDVNRLSQALQEAKAQGQQSRLTGQVSGQKQLPGASAQNQNDDEDVSLIAF